MWSKLINAYSIFMLINVLIANACQIGPRQFGFDMSMFKPVQFFRFMDHLEKLGPMNRRQFIQHFKNEVAPMAPLYEFAVNDFILTVEIAKVEAKFELFRLNQLLSRQAYNLAERIYNIEINDDLLCVERTTQIANLLIQTNTNITEEYQAKRRQYEDQFKSSRNKVIMFYESDI